MSDLIVYLNGAFVPYAEALIPVEDRGNVLADGVYEVVRFYGGRPLSFDAHLERLARSAGEIRLPPVDLAELERAGLELVRRNELSDATLYIQVTRGVAPRIHAFPDPAPKPTVFMIARGAQRPPRQRFEEGVACITVPDTRWARCDIKAIGLLPNVLAKQEAYERGAFEALFVRDGVITEGSSSNVFGVRSGRILTYPEGPHILPGITRRLILALAAEEGIEVAEEELRLEELGTFDELFISSTTVEVMPVVKVNGRPVGDGRVGPVTRRLVARYEQLVEQVRQGAAAALTPPDPGG